MALQILPIKIVLLLNYSTFEKVPIMIRLITFTFLNFPKISQSIQPFKQLSSSRKDQTQKNHNKCGLMFIRRCLSWCAQRDSNSRPLSS